MKLTHLRDVLAVRDNGSLRAAGRHLGIAQPAITRSIREIEAELGVSLFERHAKGVHLTEMGEAFVRRADAVRAELQRARDEIEQLKGHSTGEVSIAMSTATCLALMPRGVSRFRERYPDAVLKIYESLFPPIESELINGGIDLYVGPVDPAFSSTQLSVEHLFDNRRIVVARRGHPLLGATSLAELADARWVRPTLSARSTEGDFDDLFATLGLPKPNIVIHARSALITLLTVANSDLLTIVPKQWVEAEATRHMIETIKLAQPMKAAPMSILRRRDLPLTPMAEHLCDVMRRVGTQYAYDEAKRRSD